MEKHKRIYKIAAVTVVFAAACLITNFYYIEFNLNTPAKHLFYIPIILAAIWWRKRGILIAVLSAIFIILSSLFIKDAIAVAGDIFRAAMYLLVGILTALLRERVDRLSKEKDGYQKQLFQAQKMEAVGRLAGGIAHDFNNILTTIIGFSDLTIMDNLSVNDMKENSKEVKKAAMSAVSLTKQLLAFSKKQIFILRTVNINELIINSNKMLQQIIGEDISFELRLNSQVGLISIDPSQFEQILMNLIVNSQDAMPTGGIIILETNNVCLDELYCKEYYEIKPGKYVHLSISDTGSGMDEETKKKIFDPFFTTKETGKGTGLGLSTVYGIVKQSRGYINVYSEPGHGTTFKIYFPVTETSEKCEPVNNKSIKLIAGSEKILLVEDNASVRKHTGKILRKSGYTVYEAESGGKALEIIEKESIKPDLLLTDIVMPEMSGMELKVKIRKIFPDIKALCTSGYSADFVKEKNIISNRHSFCKNLF